MELTESVVFDFVRLPNSIHGLSSIEFDFRTFDLLCRDIVLYGSMQVLEMERKGEIGAKGALGRNNATPVIRWHHRKPKRNIRKNCLKAKVHATRK